MIFFCRSHPNLTFLNSASSFSSSSGRPKQLRHEAKEMVRSLQASRNSLDGAGLSGMINYRFFTAEINLKALYIFHCLFITSSVKLFVLTEQIFVYKFLVYKFLFTIVFFGKKKDNTHETFYTLKIKAHSIKNHILRMKAHFETHFENENMFLVF